MKRKSDNRTWAVGNKISEVRHLL